MRYLVLTVAMLMPLVSSHALVLLDAPVYHGATRSLRYAEDWPEDTGGVLYFFVQNTGDTEDAVADIRVAETALDEYDAVHWWRPWPRRLAPGELGWVTVKSVGPPFEQGSRPDVEVVMTSGASFTFSVHCETPSLRLANVLPAPDYESLYLYLRNDGDTTLQLRHVAFNADRYDMDHPAITIAGDEPDMPPGALRILRLQLDRALPMLYPMAVRVCAFENDTPVWTGAGIRLTEANYTIGTWESGMPEREHGQRYARKLGIDACVATRDWELQRQMYEKYHIRTLAIANHEAGDPPKQQPNLDMVRALRDSPHLAAWMVRDEPDLHSIPSERMHRHNNMYWDHDPNNPTYLNLMTTAGYNDYGHIPDIICMDHYVFFAPNNIPRTGVTRFAALKEALEFTDLLKENTEPVRMWVWPQLAAPVWNRQPYPWGVNYQFWAHVKGGAKGLLWFKYGADYETHEEYAAPTAEAVRLVRQLNQIRSLCFYGEPHRIVESDNEHLLGRALVSKDAAVVIVLNNNYETGGVPFAAEYTLHPATGTVTVSMPHWIPVEQVLQITPDGPEEVAYEKQDDTVHIRVDMHKDSRVFLVGRHDTSPPEQVTGFNLAAVEDTGAVLSWAVPFDNYGVKGYALYRDEESVAKVTSPIYTVPRAPENEGNYTIRAYDAAGNYGPPSVPVPVVFE